MKESKLLKNVIFGFGGQFLVLALGIIVPRIVISSYGSDVNGLMSTVTQVFTYMALLEAGIGQAARNALFKPLSEGDTEGINCVCSVSRRYFRKITLYYGAIVVVLSLGLPFVLKSNVGFFTIFLVVLLEGLSGVISFYYIETQTIILNADGRGYINNGVNVANKISVYLAKIFMAAAGLNIAFLQFACFLITVAKVIFYRIYFEKNYSWIDYNAASPNVKLKDRNSYIITEITWTIFSSTDLVVLSIFVSTQLASVYSVYNMVFSSLSVLLNAVYTGVGYILGQTYHEDIRKYCKIHDCFNSVFVGGMTMLMCVAYVLIIPFIKLYTKGIFDVNYIYPLLPVLFALVNILSWSRYVAGNLIGVAGHIREAQVMNILEAAINIVFSIILVRRFSITGVLIATVVALPLKVVYCNYMADRVILQRSSRKTILILGLNYLLFTATVLIEKKIEIQVDNYMDLIIWGCLLSMVVGIVGIAVNIMVNPECMRLVTEKIKERKYQK
ncbi:hypothetical protein H6B15_10480 [Gemmiger formicilis]|uniref:polysaccharide biosynthesis C-terminal domain-containing protein n=1 Tax=Gemmiger formicilis TaxID=745368 RepID=UPI00195B511F|nr:hypothetical protein [Gemmiger formicilis]